MMEKRTREYLERKTYEAVTDEMLASPISKLNGAEVAILEKAFRGPYGTRLIERLDELTSQL